MDRRNYTRIPRYIDCCLINKDTGQEYSGILKDISEGGVGIILFGENPPPKGTTCVVQFIDTVESLDQEFIVTEEIVISNVFRNHFSTQIGAVFKGRPSYNCNSYICMLSACKIIGALSFAI